MMCRYVTPMIWQYSRITELNSAPSRSLTTGPPFGPGLTWINPIDSSMRRASRTEA